MAQADVVKSLKAVTQAISQLKATPTADGRLLQLAIERIDSLVEVTSGPVSAPTSLRQSGRVSSLSCLSRSSLPALDCLSAVVTVLTDPVSPTNLLQACLQLLYALCKLHRCAHCSMIVHNSYRTFLCPYAAANVQRLQVTVYQHVWNKMRQASKPRPVLVCHFQVQ
eukprot:scpid17113/ scgid4771/ 